MSKTVGNSDKKHHKYNLYEQILHFYEDTESIKNPLKELKGSIKVSNKSWIEEVIDMEGWMEA